ncbi:hypothetical protein O7623_26300 [Solwaraspora sp. WMMD791]|uniref:hypothetical protein n=1 Tax=Solwaraspora sp. WMMD791 TaxID=3016086 RepID=UPI00249CD39D|nr:hypothetical protein [Solwaraspora sp. WMMD791]WFE26753.1 hypothetical protein O7623_26300 [Solwaraspora sp. WMMD791]
MTMFGVALFAAGLTVLLVMWPMLRPARPATEAWTVDPATGVWTVDEATGAWTVDEAGPPADRWRGGRRPAPRHRRGGRRRAGRAGLPRRRVPAGVAATATVPRQRRGGRGADDIPPRQGVVGIVGTPPEGTPPTGPVPTGPVPTGPVPPVPTGPPPATVPVIGTTVAGTPYRGVAPVPDGSRQFP